MQIKLTGVEVGLALAQSDLRDLLVLLATVADYDMQEGGALIEEIATRHNGSPYHAIVAPFLRQLADAIDGHTRTIAAVRHPATTIGA